MKMGDVSGMKNGMVVSIFVLKEEAWEVVGKCRG